MVRYYRQDLENHTQNDNCNEHRALSLNSALRTSSAQQSFSDFIPSNRAPPDHEMKRPSVFVPPSLMPTFWGAVPMMRQIEDAEWQEVWRRATREQDPLRLARMVAKTTATVRDQRGLLKLLLLLREITAAARKQHEAIKCGLATSQRSHIESDPGELLDVLLAVDRRVMELSMRIYNIREHERAILEAENRLLHYAIRNEHLAPEKFRTAAWSEDPYH